LKTTTLQLLLFTFIISSVSQVWSTLPCAPQCGSNENDMPSMHHSENMPHHADAGNDTACSGCDTCETFYSHLFNTLSSESLITRLHTYKPPYNQLFLTSKSHLPPPYLTPPA